MLPAVLPAGADARAVIAFARVPMPGRQTEIVRLAAQRLPDDVLAAMAETAERKAGEATRYAELAEGERDATLRSRLRSSADVSRAEAVGYASGCACVFALVVRGASGVAGLARRAPPSSEPSTRRRR